MHASGANGTIHANGVHGTAWTAHADESVRTDRTERAHGAGFTDYASRDTSERRDSCSFWFRDDKLSIQCLLTLLAADGPSPVPSGPQAPSATQSMIGAYSATDASGDTSSAPAPSQPGDTQVRTLRRPWPLRSMSHWRARTVLRGPREVPLREHPRP